MARVELMMCICHSLPISSRCICCCILKAFKIQYLTIARSRSSLSTVKQSVYTVHTCVGKQLLLWQKGFWLGKEFLIWKVCLKKDFIIDVKVLIWVSQCCPKCQLDLIEIGDKIYITIIIDISKSLEIINKFWFHADDWTEKLKCIEYKKNVILS